MPSLGPSLALVAVLLAGGASCDRRTCDRYAADLTGPLSEIATARAALDDPAIAEASRDAYLDTLDQAMARVDRALGAIAAMASPGPSLRPIHRELVAALEEWASALRDARALLAAGPPDPARLARVEERARDAGRRYEQAERALRTRCDWSAP